MNQPELIYKPTNHIIPTCYKCGRGYLLQAALNGKGYECESGCDKPPVIPRIPYFIEATSKRNHSVND
jgi:hypothetical protein